MAVPDAADAWNAGAIIQDVAAKAAVANATAIRLVDFCFILVSLSSSRVGRIPWAGRCDVPGLDVVVRPPQVSAFRNGAESSTARGVREAVAGRSRPRHTACENVSTAMRRDGSAQLGAASRGEAGIRRPTAPDRETFIPRWAVAAPCADAARAGGSLHERPIRDHGDSGSDMNILIEKGVHFDRRDRWRGDIETVDFPFDFRMETPSFLILKTPRLSLSWPAARRGRRSASWKAVSPRDMVDEPSTLPGLRGGEASVGGIEVALCSAGPQVNGELSGRPGVFAGAVVRRRSINSVKWVRPRRRATVIHVEYPRPCRQTGSGRPWGEPAQEHPIARCGRAGRAL